MVGKDDRRGGLPFLHGYYAVSSLTVAFCGSRNSGRLKREGADALFESDGEFDHFLGPREGSRLAVEGLELVVDVEGIVNPANKPPLPEVANVSRFRQSNRLFVFVVGFVDELHCLATIT